MHCGKKCDIQTDTQYVIDEILDPASEEHSNAILEIPRTVEINQMLFQDLIEARNANSKRGDSNSELDTMIWETVINYIDGLFVNATQQPQFNMGNIQQPVQPSTNLVVQQEEAKSSDDEDKKPKSMI